ncbi:MAG: DUF4349 domain-containing protein [Spirochaetota bacterium]
MTTKPSSGILLPVLLLLLAALPHCAREKSVTPVSQEKKSAGILEAEERPAGASAAAPLAYHEESDRRTGHPEVTPFGPVFKPAVSNERRLEYAVNLNYQITDLRSTRAFFNQWIPRYGFLLSESASGLNGGHLTLQVKVRSAQLYQALSELDSIGTLASEQITVTDHTEAGVLRSLSAAREELRLRRRSAAVQQGGAQSKNWQAAENLLAASEEKDLQNRMEEWRINDRTTWATVSIVLAMPVTPQTATIDMPHFRNAFVGVLNVLLQVFYLSIYLVPLGFIAWLLWRGFQRLRSAIG